MSRNVTLFQAMKNKLQEIRRNEGITPSELAKEAGVSTRTISRIEKGEGNSKIETLNKVLNALNKLSKKNYTFENVFNNLAQ